MHLIKACPSCKKKLRFPIDKGTINIKCSCGYSFIANPDNVEIYKDAIFDLSHSRHTLMHAIRGIKFSRIIPGIITSVLGFKYKLQNFKLLPNDEKKKVILVMMLILAVIAGLVIVLRLIFTSPGPPEGLII